VPRCRASEVMNVALKLIDRGGKAKQVGLFGGESLTLPDPGLIASFCLAVPPDSGLILDFWSRTWSFCAQTAKKAMFAS
jgi:hypothetical protein